MVARRPGSDRLTSMPVLPFPITRAPRRNASGISSLIGTVLPDVLQKESGVK